MAPHRTVRGEGEPITARETLALAESEYLEETNEVRHAVARNEEGPVEWATEPFSRYARRECAKVGSEAVRSAIEDRLGSEVEHVAAGARFDTGGDADVDAEDDADVDAELDVLVIYRVWVDDWDGGVTSAPTVDFDELVAVTPSTAKAAVEMANGVNAVGGREHVGECREHAGECREYSCEMPVFVRKTEAQLL